MHGRACSEVTVHHAPHIDGCSGFCRVPMQAQAVLDAHLYRRASSGAPVPTRNRPSARVCSELTAGPAPAPWSARPMLAAMPSVSARTGLTGAAGKQGRPSGCSSRRYAANALGSAHDGGVLAGVGEKGEGGDVLVSTGEIVVRWVKRACHGVTANIAACPMLFDLQPFALLSLHRSIAPWVVGV